MSGMMPLTAWVRTHMRIRNKFVTASISEFLGTFILCLFAVGASAQYKLIPNQPLLMPIFGSVTGLLIAIVCFGGASGAHLNPVVTLCLAIAGETSFSLLPFYCAAQFFGGYLGAGVAFAIYEYRLCVSGGDVCVEAIEIFSPLPSTPLRTGLLDQIVTVAVLIIFLFGILDPRNMKVERGLFGFYFAAVVGGTGSSFGLNAGGVMNPARDLGPRFMAVTLGHSVDDIFYFGDEPYWMVPLFGPIIGGVLGTFIYIFFVGSHLDDVVGEKDGNWNGSLDSTNWRSMLVHNSGKGRQGSSSKVTISESQSLPHIGSFYPYGLTNNGFTGYNKDQETLTRKYIWTIVYNPVRFLLKFRAYKRNQEVTYLRSGAINALEETTPRSSGDSSTTPTTESSKISAVS